MLNNKETYRLLQAKGFTLPEIKISESKIEEEINFEDFQDSIRICENCPNFTEKVMGSGPITSPLMIIGSSPSIEDIDNNKIYTDASGHFLTMALEALGVDRRCIYITNAIKCNMSGNSISPNTIATCRPYLEAEINKVNPCVIITLGGTALKAVTKHYELSIANLRGRVLSNNCTRVYPTWDPKYVLLNQNTLDYIRTKDEFFYDLKNAIEDVKKSYPNYRWMIK